MKKTAILATLGAALAMPLAASADPSVGVWSGDGAAPVPHIPGTFNGAPTNDDPNSGQFTVSFNSTGFAGVGRASEPPATIEVAPTNGLRQMHTASGSSAATERTFTNFRTQLRTLASRQPTTQTAQR